MYRAIFISPVLGASCTVSFHRRDRRSEAERPEPPSGAGGYRQPAIFAISRATPGERVRWRGTTMRSWGLLGCLKTMGRPPSRDDHPSAMSRSQTSRELSSSIRPPWVVAIMRKYMRQLGDAVNDVRKCLRIDVGFTETHRARPSRAEIARPRALRG